MLNHYLHRYLVPTWSMQLGMMSLHNMEPVIIDHDGAIDDLVAQVILQAHPNCKANINLIGVIITDADCYIKDAGEATSRLLALTGHHTSVDVGLSSLKGKHDFPSEWRKDAMIMKILPCLNTPLVNQRLKERDPIRGDITGQELLAELVLKSDKPVTIVVTGPLSNVAWCLHTHGDLFACKVKELMIMGGAVDVPGNVLPPFAPTTVPSADGTQEWNLYWDAPAAATVLHYPCQGFKRVLFALDATNSVPVHDKMVRRMGNHLPNEIAQFIGYLWATTAFQAQLYGEQHTYYAWDALTTGFLADRSLFDVEKDVQIHVVEDGPSEGRTVRVTSGTVLVSGPVDIVKPTNCQEFEERVVFRLFE